MSTVDDPGRLRHLAATPARPADPTYRPGMPNVMIVILDDLGFAGLGCYGSDIDTPTFDGLAASGVRFTNFHTTAVCSPTRACILTGRNHHRVGMGMLPDLPMNFPGYSGEFPDGAGTLAEILLDRGYATYAIGKWHLVPRDQRAAGPFHMWPTGVGFERYYGFLNGETNQWTPNLIRDQAHVEPPRTPEEGYHLDADLADEAIAHLRDLRLANPDRPFLLYFASGAPHAPHHAPPEWMDRYRGRFDTGWDAWRSQVLERQKRLGVVPQEVELPPLPSYVEPWDSIDPDRQRLYARMMEAFAAFVAHVDHQVGRVLAHLEATGERENTIVVLVSDNGASAEGGPNGSWNQMRHYISDEPDDLATELAHIDDIGGHRASNHYPWGWALAGNTPFHLWKRYTYEGGVRDPFIVSWPAGLGEHAGSVRGQYGHVVDVLPTLLDLLGIEPPSVLAGVPQMSLDGTP
jgi:arylsulfatase A-like enzyme